MTDSINMAFGALAALLFEIRALDLLDISIVAALIYAGVGWLRKGRAGMVALGLMVVVMLYSIGRAVGLQLTTGIFEGFFAFSLVVLVVIFQEELRQIFERVAQWGLRRSMTGVVDPLTSEILAGCLVDFARDRVGALVVLPRTQPLDRYLRGGIQIDARLSTPLLKSIFDHHSPGHDGAVLVVGNKMTKFAVHLPLSDDVSQLGPGGTRHSAALGITQRTDAIALVVSEERGEISIARDGKLNRLREPIEIARTLSELQKSDVEAPRGWISRLRGRVSHLRWFDLAASSLATLGIWILLIPGVRETDLEIAVPVQVRNLPESYILEQVDPKMVTVTLTGPARAFYLMDANAIEVTVDATLAELGRRTFSIERQKLGVPKGVMVSAVDPPRIKISLRKPNG